MANERRLIDANALLEKLHRMIDYCESDRKVDGLTALFQVGDAVMDCPTVDAVIPVRCKDCKYWEKHHYEYRTDGECSCLIKYHDAERYMTEADHYCAYGERRCE